jgi:hypothetical protein
MEMNIPDGAARRALGIPAAMPDFVIHAAVLHLLLVEDAIAQSDRTGIRVYGESTRGWRWVTDLLHLDGEGQEACAIAKRLFTDDLAIDAWSALRTAKDRPLVLSEVISCAIIGGVFEVSERVPLPVNTRKLEKIESLTRNLQEAIGESGLSPDFFDIEVTAIMANEVNGFIRSDAPTAALPVGLASAVLDAIKPHTAAVGAYDALSQIAAAAKKAKELVIPDVPPHLTGYKRGGAGDNLALRLARVLQSHGINSWAETATRFAGAAYGHRCDIQPDTILKRFNRK